MLRTLYTAFHAIWNETRCQACAVPIITGQENTARILQPDLALCEACAAHLTRRVSGFCPGCGELTSWEDISPSLCSRCLTKPPPWKHFLFHNAYTGLLRELLLRVKHGNDLAVANMLGLVIAAHPKLPELQIDCVVPVPLHPKRLYERGFNQSQELARPIARRFGLGLYPHMLVRTTNTKAQAQLSLTERQQNVQGIFTCPKPLPPNTRVLLIDDIATTGATLREATMPLLQAGALSVDILVIARTPRGS